MEKVEKLVKPWYDALEEGKILARKCKQCGHIEFPPRYACNECGCLETEWAEISGKGTALNIIPQSPLSNNPDLTERIGDFMWATVKIDEGDVIDAINTCLIKVGPDRLAELRSKLPVKVKPSIVQMDGYKMLYWEVDE